MIHYQSKIKNALTGEWVKKESNGELFLTENEEEAILFRSELKADSMLENLNETYGEYFAIHSVETQVQDSVLILS